MLKLDLIKVNTGVLSFMDESSDGMKRKKIWNWNDFRIEYTIRQIPIGFFAIQSDFGFAVVDLDPGIFFLSKTVFYLNSDLWAHVLISMQRFWALELVRSRGICLTSNHQSLCQLKNSRTPQIHRKMQL